MFKLHDIYKQTDQRVGQGKLRQILVAFIILLIPVLAFSYIAYNVHEGATIAVDSHVLLGIHSWTTPLLNDIVLATTDIGGTLGVLIIGTTVVALYAWRHKWQACTQIVAGIAGAALLNFILKYVFERDRPELWTHLITETNYSFPSGHAMISSALAFSLVVVLWHTKYRWLAFAGATVYILWTGFTRLYLGVHYPTDVVAGWCVSAAWVLAVAFILGSVSFSRNIKKA